MSTAHRVSSEAAFFVNPFSTKFVRPGSIPYRFPTGTSQQGLVQSIRAAKRSLIVGAHGTGKSTLIETLIDPLRESFPAVERVQLHAAETRKPIDLIRHRSANLQAVIEQQERLQQQAESGLLIVDGIEQLGRVGRTRVLARAIRMQQFLMATSHVEMIGMRCVYRTHVSAKLIRDLLDYLLADSSADVVQRLEAAITDKKVSNVQDVRSFLFRMYDLAANVHATNIDLTQSAYAT